MALNDSDSLAVSERSDGVVSLDGGDSSSLTGTSCTLPEGTIVLSPAEGGFVNVLEVTPASGAVLCDELDRKPVGCIPRENLPKLLSRLSVTKLKTTCEWLNCRDFCDQKALLPTLVVLLLISVAGNISYCMRHGQIQKTIAENQHSLRALESSYEALISGMEKRVDHKAESRVQDAVRAMEERFEQRWRNAEKSWGAIEQQATQHVAFDDKVVTSIEALSRQFESFLLEKEASISAEVSRKVETEASSRVNALREKLQKELFELERKSQEARRVLEFSMKEELITAKHELNDRLNGLKSVIDQRLTDPAQTANKAADATSLAEAQKLLLLQSSFFVLTREENTKCHKRVDIADNLLKASETLGNAWKTVDEATNRRSISAALLTRKIRGAYNVASRCFTPVVDYYDNHVKGHVDKIVQDQVMPAFGNITRGVSRGAAEAEVKTVEFYNNHLKEPLRKVAKGVKPVYEQQIAPLASKIAKGIKTFVEKSQPFP